MEAKSALWREGGVEPERFSLVWGSFACKRKRKPRKKCLARCGRLRWLVKLPRRTLAVGESPKVAAILWIAPIGDELTLSLAKNSHFSFLPSHFPSLPSRRGYHCGAENRNEFTLSIAKFFFALSVPPLLNGTSRATSDRKLKTNDQILPSPILFFPSKNWVKLIPKTIGNRKRDCAWGGSGW